MRLDDHVEATGTQPLSVAEPRFSHALAQAQERRPRETAPFGCFSAEAMRARGLVVDADSDLESARTRTSFIASRAALELGRD
jgi:hypothetical protein